MISNPRISTEMQMSGFRSFVVLLATTWAFTICFAVWMMFGVTGIPIREQLGLNSVEFGLLTATPVLTGALFRLPLGIWTDRLGGRRLMLALLTGCAVPVWLSSYATALWHFILLGLALGLVGASFSVGTPYVARFFPKEKRGFAMGFFGAGTVGAALNMFVAPWLISAFGWQTVPKVYASALIVTAVIFWVFSAPDPARAATSPSMVAQLQVLRDLDAAVFQVGIWALDCAGFTTRRVFRSSGRRLPCLRRVALRSFRRAQRHMVGAVDRLDLPVPALLSTHRTDRPYG
jgi:NNP family nitrate/nitrite transporter-like MFS transporter